MKKTILLSALALTLLAAGCTVSKPIPASQAKFIPDNRIYNKQLIAPKAGSGEVVVKRDGGFVGSLCNIKVFVDGNLSAEIAPGEKVIFYLPEGPHILGVWPNKPCGGGAMEMETEALVTTKRSLAFRVGYGVAAGYFIYPTTL